MKKKVLSLLLAAAMVVSMTACGAKNDAPANTDTPSTEQNASNAGDSDLSGTYDIVVWVSE